MDINNNNMVNNSDDFTNENNNTGVEMNNEIPAVDTYVEPDDSSESKNKFISVEDIEAQEIAPESLIDDTVVTESDDTYDYDQTNYNKSINNHANIVNNYNQMDNYSVDDSESVSSYEEQLNNSEDISFDTQGKSEYEEMEEMDENGYIDSSSYDSMFEQNDNNTVQEQPMEQPQEYTEYDQNIENPGYVETQPIDNQGYDEYNQPLDNQGYDNYNQPLDNQGYDNYNQPMDYNQGYDNYNQPMDYNQGYDNYNQPMDYNQGYDNYNQPMDYNQGYDEYNQPMDYNQGYDEYNQPMDYNQGYDDYNQPMDYSQAYEDNNQAFSYSPNPEPEPEPKEETKFINAKKYGLDKSGKGAARAYNFGLIFIYLVIFSVIGYIGYSLIMDKSTFYFSKDRVNILVGASYEESILVKGKEDSMDNYTWTSENNDIATVDNKGVITAKGEGQTNIVATSKKTKKSNIVSVNVIKLDIKTFTIKPDTKVAIIGNTYTLTPSINGQSSIIANYVWKSSDPSVATVNDDGEIEALKKGSTKITASIPNTKFTATSLVTVIEKK